jgi:NADH dehydrogenase FAD-containing subunit
VGTLSLIAPASSPTTPSISPAVAPFQYSHFASIASVGKWKGVYDSTNIAATQPEDSAAVSGFLAFILWRSAYWTKQVSLVNKILIPMYWFKSAVFGRDISRF